MPTIYREVPVITVSESSKKEILALGLGTPQSVTIVNPGITLDHFRLGKKTNHPSLCYVGRLKSYKNLDVAIQAMAEVIKFIPTAHLTIAGSGESLAELQELTIKLNLQSHVTFAGAVSDKEKANLLARSWLAVQPSMIEGWGITVIEANAAGTPVVASRVNGLKDSVKDGETGVLVAAKDVPAFAAAIIQLLSNKKRLNRFSVQAYNWSRGFDWEVSVSNLVEVMSSYLYADHVNQMSSKSAKHQSLATSKN